MNKFKLNFLVIILVGSLSLLSCSKEEEEIPVAKAEVESFDKGHLLIKVLADPALTIDSIKYFNNTKGTSFDIPISNLGYDVLTNVAFLSKSLLSGKTNDQVQCCIYVKSPISVGAVFEDITSEPNYLDSINTINTGGNPVYCIVGLY